MDSRRSGLILASIALFGLVAAPCLSQSKGYVSAWLAADMGAYRQKYALSCEIALIRVSLAIAGRRGIGEDDILARIPKGRDPETSFVCDDISGGRRDTDGSVHWDNYGTHPPVVAAAINAWLSEGGAGGPWKAYELRADDAALRRLATGASAFRGAILWVVGHPERWGEHPPVNDRGMVLGEHVRFLDPVLAPNGAFRIWDPETGKSSVSFFSGAARDEFGYRIVALYRVEGVTDP
jgi:hypothetical protein